MWVIGSKVSFSIYLITVENLLVLLSVFFFCYNNNIFLLLNISSTSYSLTYKKKVAAITVVKPLFQYIYSSSKAKKKSI
jgi:hypothetical protein